jgi:hypothetical protein
VLVCLVILVCLYRRNRKLKKSSVHPSESAQLSKTECEVSPKHESVITVDSALSPQHPAFVRSTNAIEDVPVAPTFFPEPTLLPAPTFVATPTKMQMASIMTVSVSDEEYSPPTTLFLPGAAFDLGAKSAVENTVIDPSAEKYDFLLVESSS